MLYEVITLLRTGNGESIPAEINTTIYREKGEAASVISLVRDISLRKKIQVALENSEARLKDRITSYNVCYTKLLRAVSGDRQGTRCGD